MIKARSGFGLNRKRNCCEYFLTTDDGIIRKANLLNEISVVDPPTFLREVEP